MVALFLRICYLYLSKMKNIYIFSYPPPVFVLEIQKKVVTLCAIYREMRFVCLKKEKYN